MSTCKACLDFCRLFEAEVLLELMLRYWKHPMADDESFRQQLIEDVTKALRLSVEGTRLHEDIEPTEMNFVAALWCVEWNYIANNPSDDPQGNRRAWLETVQRWLPSCFCKQENLG